MATTGGLTPGRNSRRQRHPRALDDEELFIIEGSPTAETGAQLRDNPEEREKGAKCAKKPISSVTARSQGHPTLSMNCNSRNIDHPVRVLHLRYFHSFCTVCTIQPVVAQQRACPNHSKNCTWRISGLLHSFALWALSQ